ncbi:hypothetical protein ACLB2K_077132 [Fragaria x ananassa]
MRDGGVKRVLDVSPLRRLVPVFPSTPHSAAAPPFVCVSPAGPFPPGVSPFFPFFISNQNALPPSTAGVTPNRYTTSPVNSDDTRRPKSQKRTRGGQDIDVQIDAILDNILASFTNTLRQSDGDKELVRYALLSYDLLRRRISQIEEIKEGVSRIGRSDLRAGTLFMNKGIRTNAKKRIGAVPGVQVGDIFFFRMELCLVGLHAPTMGGIDYMGVKNSSEEEPLALSIVSSGGYEDHMQDGNELIYSGQGGNANNDNRKDKEIKDQKLERGNLALEKSLHRGNDVRVIRGLKDVSNPLGKVYVYDGLYKINESWVDKGKSGANVFKYKLVRLPGAETFPVSLVNDVDGEKGPVHFTYIPSLKYPEPVKLAEPTAGCNCTGGCLPGNSNCLCIQKNGGYLPYNSNGLLVNQKSLLHECGSSCKCSPNCRNRVSQGDLKIRLEVFMTKDKGWGLRSWDPIRAGAFLCEYAGEALNVSGIEKLGDDHADDYSFDATRTCQPLAVLPGDSNEAPNVPFPLHISANTAGNVARFMNHSCSPNVFWQPVLRENKNEADLHVAFYAAAHIPPMTELTYDYGLNPHGKAYQRKKLCLCGSTKCRSFFY